MPPLPMHDISPSEPVLLGFDIGGTKTAAVLGTNTGEVLDWMEIPTPATEPFETALTAMTSLADKLLEAAGQRGWPRPKAISVAVGGPLDIDQGVIFSPPHLPTWDRAPLKARLEAYYQVPVFVEHDGSAGALAEYYFGAGQGHQNLVFLTMGTGLGAGIILDGKIYHGASCAAGEVGHVRLAESGPVEYGKAGSWESYCSGAGIAKLAHLREPERWAADVSTQTIIQAALSGEPAAVQLVKEVGSWLGKGIAFLADILNPDVIVVGTLGVVLGDLLLEPARAALRAEALPVTANVCQVVPAQLGNQLGKVAALIAAISAYRQGQLGSAGMSDDAVVQASLQASLQAYQRMVDKQQAETLATGRLLVAALRAGGKMLLCGNGGSAATAQHLAGELVGRYKINRRALAGVALTADSSVVTCIGNDYAYDEIFARQVAALGRPGDVLVGFTTSGRSPNVLKALQTARALGLQTVAMTGEKGLAEPLADYEVRVPSSQTARIQEAHDAIMHAWCELIDRAFGPA